MGNRTIQQPVGYDPTRMTIPRGFRPQPIAQNPDRMTIMPVRPQTGKGEVAPAPNSMMQGLTQRPDIATIMPVRPPQATNTQPIAQNPDIATIMPVRPPQATQAQPIMQNPERMTIPRGFRNQAIIQSLRGM